MSAAACLAPPRATRSKTFISRAPACHDSVSPFLVFVAAVEVGEKAVALARAEEEFLKGNELCDARRFEDAVVRYDRAIELGLRDHVVWNNKGVALDSLGRHEDAVACYEKSLAANSEYEIAWYNKGNAYSYLGQYDRAVECYDRAIAADGSMTIAYLYKGGLFNRMERFSEALECYEQALRTQEKQQA